MEGDANPAHNWTVTRLAREAGMSRSALAERFTHLIGESPIRYLAGWRIQLAKQILRDGASGVAEVAAHVGYQSEAAFNRAFKRFAGVPPAAWRRSAISALVSACAFLLNGESMFELAWPGF